MEGFVRSRRSDSTSHQSPRPPDTPSRSTPFLGSWGDSSGRGGGAGSARHSSPHGVLEAVVGGGEGNAEEARVLVREVHHLQRGK